MPQELVQINARRLTVKVLLILILIGSGVWSYYVLRWYLGNTLADYFDTGENNLELARWAGSLAPSDPLTHWRIGKVSEVRLPMDQQAGVIAEYEKAVRLSPNDYRLWMALGTAHEQSGDIAKGEEALRRALALAPSYAYPHWYLGNLLLRSGRYTEAFAELRVAGEAAEELRPQFFNLLLEIYGNDFESLKQGVGEDPRARADLALYLLRQTSFDNALRLWNSITREDKKANRSAAESMIAGLVSAGRFHDAVNVWNDIVPADSYRIDVGRIFDGGFEEAVNYGSDKMFGWRVKGASQVQIGIDPTKGHSGARSLRLVFQVRSKLDSIGASQLIPVLPQTEYDFECYVKTEKLDSGSTPVIQIVNPQDGAVLVSSNPAPTGDKDWTQVALNFKSGEKTEAVTLQIVRPSCGEGNAICPIFGAVWYDDFSLKRRD